MTQTTRAMLAAFSAMTVVASTLVLLGVNPASADGGDIQSINFAAEDPDEYDHATGGGAFGSDTDGDGKDTVESLQGGDFACGDLVSYFVKLAIQGDGSDDPQTIQLTNTFLADATGQSGAGLTDVVNVLIDPTDPAQVGNGDSTVTVIDEGIDANGAAPYTNDGAALSGGADSAYVTYQVDGLETGETVIVRIDVLIECAANSSPTGNLQGDLAEADIVAVNGGTEIDPDAVPGGKQTIPFQQIGSLVGAGEPTLDIQKTAMATGGTCGVDDVESLDITVGDTVTYCYLVTNDGTADLENASISDDNGTPGDLGDDFTVAVGTVASVSSTYVNADVTITSIGTVVNTATATGDGPRNTTLTDTDTATVVATGTTELSVNKVFTGITGGDGDADAEAGETLNYTITATNSGDVPVNNVVVSDDLTNDSIICPTLAPGETCELVTAYVVTLTDVEAGNVANTGTADSDETDPIDDTEDVPIVANPSLTVIKVLSVNADEDGSGDVSLGDTLTYTVTATNDGDVTLNNVMVSDDLTGQSTSCVSVAVGSTCVLTATYIVSSADVEAGGINNIGTADSDETDPVSDPETVDVTQNPSLSVDKLLTGHLDVDDDGDVELGDTLTYTITATNDGDVTLTNVVVSDELTGDSDSCASVAPGATCVLTVDHVVTAADVAAGQVSNTATADSDQTDPVKDTEIVPTTANPALGIDKALTANADEDGNGEVSVDDTLTYTITATNDGDVTLNNVVVSDDLTGQSTTCDLVAVGDTCVLTATYVVTQADVEAGVINNIGTADSDETDPVADPETVDVAQNPSLSVDKVRTGHVDVDDDGDVELGDTLTYTITATNDGDITLTNVVVSDELTGDSDSCASVAPGATCVLTVDHVVTAADVAAGQVSNTATADSDQTDPVKDTEIVPTTANPALGIDKALTVNADEDGSGDVSVDDTLTYEITATNKGDVPVSNVVVSDDLTGQSTTCDLVAVGDTCVLTATYVVTQADVDAGAINNTGTADSDQTDPVADRETVDINQVVTVDLTKTGDLDVGADGVANPGDVITYSFTVRNTGNVTLTGVDVSDPGVSGLTCDADTLAPGGSTACSGTYAITQADIDAGQYDNTASVSTDQGASDIDTHSEPIPQTPVIEVDKVLLGNDDADGSGDVSLGDTLTYGITATNTGNTTLQMTVVDNLTGDSTSCADVAPAGTCELTVTYTVTQADVDAGEVSNTAVADSDQTPPEDDTEVVDIPQIADIDLIKTGVLNDGGDGVANVGDTVDYSFVVTNTGNVTLTDVTVDDDLLGGVVCTIDSLAVDDTETCTGSYTLTQADINAGGVDNVAIAEGTPPDGAPPVSDADDDGNPDDPGDATVNIPEAPDITVTKEGSLDTGADGIANPGDVVSYTLVVSNTGNVPLSAVSIDDPLLGGVVCSFDSLAVGASETCSGSYALTQADLDAGERNNSATASGTSPKGTDVGDDASAKVDVPQTVTLDIDKLTNGADDNVILEGSPITWTYKVSNTGTTTLTNVGVSDDQGVTVSCPATELAPGESTTCTGEGTATAGVYANIGTASAEGPQGQPADNSDDSGYLGASPSVSITKVFADDEVTTGGPDGTFELMVMNNGNVDLAGVSIVDSVPGELVVTGVTSSDADCAASTGQEVDCVTDLAVGDSATVTVTFSVDSASQAGVVENTAFATADYTDDLGNTATASDDDTDTIEVVTDINLNLVKMFDPDAVDSDGSGQFTLVVTNEGPSDAVDVVVTDTVDSRLVVTNVSTTAGACSGTQSINCTMDLAAGDSATITVAYDVDVFLEESDDFDTRDGASFRFEFTNGFVLEGASDKQVTLYDPAGDVVETYSGRKKNDFLWSAPNGTNYDLHLSCSELYGGGLDDEWVVSTYSINRYKKGKFFRSCGEVVTPLEIENTATASVVESGGNETAIGTASLIVNPGGFITTPSKG